jgi:hypothetical protein
MEAMGAREVVRNGAGGVGVSLEGERVGDVAGSRDARLEGEGEGRGGADAGGVEEGGAELGDGFYYARELEMDCKFMMFLDLIERGMDIARGGRAYCALRR